MRPIGAPEATLGSLGTAATGSRGWVWPAIPMGIQPGGPHGNHLEIHEIMRSYVR